MHAGLAELPCEVRKGGLRDAILHSAGANSDHGVRRSNADKRRAALILLEDEEWSQWNKSEIARRCAVAESFVRKLRSELPSSHEAKMQAARTVSRGGTVYPIKPRSSSPRLADPTPSEPGDLADALARQFRQEAEQVRGPQSGSAALARHWLRRDPKWPTPLRRGSPC